MTKIRFSDWFRSIDRKISNFHKIKSHYVVYINKFWENKKDTLHRIKKHRYFIFEFYVFTFPGVCFYDSRSVTLLTHLCKKIV